MAQGLGDVRLRFEDRPRPGDPPDFLDAARALDQAAEDNLSIDMSRLGEVLKHPLRVPEYQRSYKWKPENWDDLWKEISPLFSADFDEGRAQDLFFGVMFLAEDQGAEHEGYEVIDGQQRTTTVSLLFRAVLDHLGDAQVQVEDSGLERYATMKSAAIWGAISRGDGASIAPSPRIELNKHNREFYQTLIATDDYRMEAIQELESTHGNRKKNAISAQELVDKLGLDEEQFETDWLDENLWLEETNKSLLECYSFFRDRLTESMETLSPEQKIRALTNLVSYVENCFVLGLITVERERPTLLMSIFQVLNDRGMELQLTDVIRARVVSRFREDLSEEEAAEYIAKWEAIVEAFGDHYESLNEYLVDFFTAMEPSSGVRSTIKEHILEIFALDASSNDRLDSYLENVNDARSIVQALEDHTEDYLALSLLSDEGLRLQDKTNRILAEDMLRRLDHLRTRQWMPFIFAVYKAVLEAPGGTKDDELISALESVEKVSLRQSIAGLNPNRLEKIYNEALREFEANGLEMDFEAFLGEAFASEYSEAWGQRFLSTLYEKEDWPDRLGRVILWKLVSADLQSSEMLHKELVLPNIHLEHILPKKINRKDADGDYVWLRNLVPSTPGYEAKREDYETLLQISESNPAVLSTLTEEIESHFIKELSNMTLLLGTDNVSIGNKPFSEKIAAYHGSDEFRELSINQGLVPEELPEDLQEIVLLKSSARRIGDGNWEQIASDLDVQASSREEVERAIASRLEKADESVRLLDDWWNLERMAERKARLLEDVVENLMFDGEDLLDSYSPDSARSNLRTRLDILIARHSEQLREARDE